MTIAQLFGAELSECQIISEIKNAMAAGLPEVKLGGTIVNLPGRITAWEFQKD